MRFTVEQLERLDYAVAKAAVDAPTKSSCDELTVTRDYAQRLLSGIVAGERPAHHALALVRALSILIVVSSDAEASAMRGAVFDGARLDRDVATYRAAMEGLR